MKVYYLVKTTFRNNDGPDLLYTVLPCLKAVREHRSAEEAAGAAGTKGFEISFVSCNYGISTQRGDEIRKAVMLELRKEFLVHSDWDIDLDVCVRITDHGRAK